MNTKESNVFIIILNWNNFPDTDNCIKSLIEQNDSRIRIIVVDNYSDDDSATKLKSKYPDIKLIVSKQNLGYAGGMNLGIKFSLENNADYIVVSNNDIIYPQNFLEPMLELFTKNSEIGIVSPKVLYMHDKNKIYCSGGEFSYWRASGVAFNQGKNADLFDNEIREITMAEGSCFIAKSEVFRKCGLISEKFFMYFEDLEFSDRVRKFFKIYYTPFSKVYHKGGAGNSWENHSPLYYYYYTRNRYFYFRDKNFIVKLYVTFYSLLISMIKCAVILKSLIFNQDVRYKKIESLKSLFKGNIHGLKKMFFVN